MARPDRHLRRHEAPEPRKPSLIGLQKQAVAAAHAAMNGHDAKRYSELFATDATVDEYGLGEAKSRDAIAAGFQGALNAFPDYKIGASRIFVKNDLLVQEWIITGTNRGEFNGAKPTNNVIGIRGASVLTFTPEGLIQTERRYFDTGTVVAQLGLTNAAAPPIAALPSRDPEWHIAKGTPAEDKLVAVTNAIKGAFEQKTEADFPDAKFSSTVVFGVDDVVVSEVQVTAIRAGKPFTMHGLDIMVVKDGKPELELTSSYSNSFEMIEKS